MYCERCGSKVEPGDRYCTNCGAPLPPTTRLADLGDRVIAFIIDHIVVGLVVGLLAYWDQRQRLFNHLSNTQVVEDTVK